MASYTPIALQMPWRQSTHFLASDQSFLKTIVQSGYTNNQTAPTKLFSLMASNNDPVNTYTLQIAVFDSLGTTFLGTVSIPPNSGYTAAAQAVNILNALSSLPTDDIGSPYLFLNPTDLLQAKLTTTVSGVYVVAITAFGADF